MNTLITTAILLIIASPIFASTVEFDQSGENSQIQLYVEKPLSEKIGAFLYNCQSENWGQTRVGLTYTPIATVKVGFGAGIETGGTRIGGSIWAGKEKLSGIYFLESGPGGTWDKLVTKYQFNDKLALGWNKKMYAGQGFYAEFKLSKEATVKYSGFETPEIALQFSF